MVRAISIWRVHSITIWILFVCATTFFGGFFYAHAATSTVIYASDFSSDPGWITDQPENFYWSATSSALFAHTMNVPTTTATATRYFYIETELNPRLSYELSWDAQITAMGGPNGGSGSMPFGLYGARLDSFNPLNLTFSGNYQDGTFGTRFMQLDGIPTAIFTEVNPGFNKHMGVANYSRFALGRWYTNVLSYDAHTHSYTFTIKVRDTGALQLQRTIVASSTLVVNPELRRVGISMHPEGIGVTNLNVNYRNSGYAEFLIDNVKVTQIYDEDLSAPSSVLFLPGIQSSRLYTEGLTGENQLWEPNRNADVEKLAISEEGVSEDIYTRDVMDSAFGIVPIYEDFFSHLDSLRVSGVISDWEPFAYDWRYDVEDIARRGTRYEDGMRDLVATLEALSRNNNSRVTILAHSNGGLLAKALLRRLEEEGKDYLVDTLIFLASPQIGTPKAIGSILHGYDQALMKGLLVSDEVARDAIRNMPGAYGLLPSEEYFSQIPGPVVTFSVSSTTHFLSDAYAGGIADSDTLTSFMTGRGDGRAEASTVSEVGIANESLVQAARTVHRAVLDPWRAPSHVTIYEIVGTGLDTVRGFHYQEFDRIECSGTICIRIPYYEATPLFTQYGDGTVVATSAVAYGGEKVTYYVDLEEVKRIDSALGVSHADISELESAQVLISSILKKASTPIPFVYTTPRTFGSARDIVSVHSPLSLSATDASGRRVGIVGVGAEARIQTDIPGSAYFEFGESKYIVIPSQSEYAVALEGEGEGSFTLRVTAVTGEENPLPLSLLVGTTSDGVHMDFSKSQGIFTDVSYDYDGDGTVDAVMTLNGEPTTEALYATLRTLITGLSLLKESERAWLLNAVDRAEKTGVRKGDGSSNVANIFVHIEGRLQNYVVAGTVSSTVYAEIVRIINEIKTR